MEQPVEGISCIQFVVVSFFWRNGHGVRPIPDGVSFLSLVLVERCPPLLTPVGDRPRRRRFELPSLFRSSKLSFVCLLLDHQPNREKDQTSKESRSTPPPLIDLQDEDFGWPMSLRLFLDTEVELLSCFTLRARCRWRSNALPFRKIS